MKTQLVKTGLAVLSALKADRWLARPADWAGTALMFHRVRPQSADPFRPNAHLEITPDFLEKVVIRLRELGIAIVDLDEAVDRLNRPESYPREKFAVLTFDDGYADNFDHAYPILKRLSAPFTVFVASGMIDGTATAWWMLLEEILRKESRIAVKIGALPFDLTTVTVGQKHKAFTTLYQALVKMPEHERNRTICAMADNSAIDPAAMLADNMMTWNQVRDLGREPLATLGSHTVNHLALARIGEAESRAEITGGIARMTEMLGKVPAHFAYPYGGTAEVSERDMQLAAEAGISIALTTRRGMLTAGRGLNPVAWPRLSMNGHYQDRRYLDILLSGVPFMLENLNPRRLIAPAAKSRTIVARTASSGKVS